VTNLNDGVLYTIPGGAVVRPYLRDCVFLAHDEDFIENSVAFLEMFEDTGDLRGYLLFSNGNAHAVTFFVPAGKPNYYRENRIADDPSFTADDLALYDENALAEMLSWLNLDDGEVGK
jgi:hypothetical protein